MTTTKHERELQHALQNIDELKREINSTRRENQDLIGVIKSTEEENQDLMNRLQNVMKNSVDLEGVIENLQSVAEMREEELEGNRISFTSTIDHYACNMKKLEEEKGKLESIWKQTKEENLSLSLQTSGLANEVSNLISDSKKRTIPF